MNGFRAKRTDRIVQQARDQNIQHFSALEQLTHELCERSIWPHELDAGMRPDKQTDIITYISAMPASWRTQAFENSLLERMTVPLVFIPETHLRLHALEKPEQAVACAVQEHEIRVHLQLAQGPLHGHG